MRVLSEIRADVFRPLHDSVFVTDLEHGVHRTQGGVILPDDNMKERGIRPRWGKVFAVGPEVDDLKPGDWVLISHGRWTNGIDLHLNGERHTIWRIDYPNAVLLVSDTDPRTTQQITL